MRRKFAFLLLSLFLMVGTGYSFAERNNGHGGKERQEQRGHRQGNNGNHNNGNRNNSGKNHNSNKKRDYKKGFGRPGGNNGNHGNMNQSRPGGGNGNHGNMNQGRPGGNNHKNPGGNRHDVFRPGNNKPAGHHPGPGHVVRPVSPSPRPVGPSPAPVVRPGVGFHYGPALPPPPPRLPYMVEYITRGCRDVDVWQVDSETFIVKYRRGGRWYTQYVYPFAEQYGHPTLISVNWRPMTPWTLIPPIQLNINL